jgi:hypothetical protein
MRSRVCSRTTTLPLCNATARVARLFSNSSICRSGLRSVPRLNSTTDGLRSSRSASRAPKSVSADTSILSCSLAKAKIASSSDDCIPKSRTCAASCPACRRPFATMGESAASTRNLTKRLAATRAHVPQRPHISMLLIYLRAQDRDRRREFPQEPSRPRSSTQWSQPECAVHECRECRPFDQAWQ